LTAVDQNGQTYEVGTVTSDMSGLYSITWTPTAEGKYTIKAEFAGSNSYYASSAETALAVSSSASANVNPAPQTTQTPPPVDAPPVETPMTTYLAITIAVVIILVVAAALVLRRRK
jgi:cytoskeletal protein RodZ